LVPTISPLYLMKDCKKIIEIIKNLLDNLSQLLLPQIKKKKKTVQNTNHDHFKIFVNQYFWPIHILVQSKRLKRYFLCMLMAYWQAEQSKASTSWLSISFTSFPWLEDEHLAIPTNVCSSTARNCREGYIAVHFTPRQS
jgi:hypothetical protein